MLISAADHAEYAVPEQFKKLGREILQQLSLFRKMKKGVIQPPQEISTPKQPDIPNQMSRVYTSTSVQSEKEPEPILVSDLDDAYQSFITVFGEFPKEAVEFVNQLKQVNP